MSNTGSPIGKRGFITQPLPGTRWQGPSGECYITRPSTDTLFILMRGRLEAPAGDTLHDGIVRELTRQPASTYWDLWDMVYYHSNVRARCTDALANGARSGRLLQIHSTAQSKIVLMGISVANLALDGRIRVHGDRDAFDAELIKAITARP
jgi:hypothetical protein